jgi:hypothetical protein
MVAPAATLLLPYFEVDVRSPFGETTLFTVINMTHSPRIARVTLWTDRAFPVFSFNIFLTGYDVQAINLYDVIARGRLAEPGTSSDSDVGRRSLDNDENPSLDISNCDRLPVILRQPLLGDILSAFTLGRTAACGTADIGGKHANAIGYATIDVVANCKNTLPTDDGYFNGDALYDNALSGDYQQLNGLQNFAQGGTMVHIRATPEGGAPGVHETNLPRTFYSHQLGGATYDRRQPLPSTFAARWIAGGGTNFDTSFKIWREGVAPKDANCSTAVNGTLGVTEIVRFDEHENPVASCPNCAAAVLSSSSKVNASSGSFFPPSPSADVAGWMYMNLDNGAMQASAPSQNWVVVSMAADGRYSVDFDAALLGNGCSGAVAPTDADGGAPAIAPASRVNRTSMAAAPATTNNDDSCDIMVAPAATLLLPYFEVDFANPVGETTLFTITNVTQAPRIARVTIWSDFSYPLLTFNIFLTGYDVQSINLFDVLARGRLAGPGTSSNSAVGRRSGGNDANPLLDLSSCGNLPDHLTAPVITDLIAALTTGRTPACGNARIGSPHTRAIGYLTVDVVQNCAPALPTDAGYFTRDLLYDNVLIGDYQQVNSSQNFAQANAMVHIRAIPEGGVAGAGETRLARTFYSHYQTGGARDRRQPLPSYFAARWISGGSNGFATTFKIWREGLTGATAGCAVSRNTQLNFYPDFVRFDEEENSTTFTPDEIITVPPPSVMLASSFRLRATDNMFPPNPDGAVAGWMYINLDDYRSRRPGELTGSQNWIIVSMTSDGRYSVDFDATPFGNGCSLPMPVTDEDGGLPAIGPAPNTNP